MSSLQGATADVPASEFQKLRIGLVKNSQRFVSNLGPGLIAAEPPKNSSGRQHREEVRPEKRHIAAGSSTSQGSHLQGAGLSIHQKERSQGRQVSGKVTNRSHFIAPGVADNDDIPISSRRLGKKTALSRVGTQGHLGRDTGLRPEPGSSSPAKRQLKATGTRDMLTTTEQVATRRGRKSVRTASPPAVGGVIGGVGESDRPAAGKPSSPRHRELRQSRGVGSQQVPRTPGGNSQIVFG